MAWKNKYSFCEECHSSSLLSISTSSYLAVASPSSHAISRELLRFILSKTAIMASSMAGIIAVGGRPTFGSVIGYTYILSHGDSTAIIEKIRFRMTSTRLIWKKFFLVLKYCGCSVTIRLQLESDTQAL